MVCTILVVAEEDPGDHSSKQTGAKFEVANEVTPSPTRDINTVSTLNGFAGINDAVGVVVATDDRVAVAVEEVERVAVPDAEKVCAITGDILFSNSILMIKRYCISSILCFVSFY